jgi:general secretion pathway protein D
MIQRSLGRGLLPAALLLAVCSTVHGEPKKAHANEAARPSLVQRAYAVADLVVPVETDKEPDRSLNSPLRYLYQVRTNEDKSPPATEEHSLMELISSRVAPASWQGNGGKGSMKYVPLAMSLVIEQTPEVHEQVEELLAGLRRLLDVEVAVDLRLLSLPDSALKEITQNINFASQTIREVDKAGLERIGIDFSKNVGPGQPMILDDSQVRNLIAFAQENRSANLVQAPKITLFNGQGRTLSIGEERQFVTDLETVNEADRLVVRPKTETVKLGMRCGLQPVVSADRRQVRLNVDFCMRQLDSAAVSLVPVVFAPNGGEGRPLPLVVERPKIHTCKLDRTLTIADGRTAVLRCGTQLVESRQEFGPPVLSQLSYVNRLFRNVGYGRESKALLILITPRVIIQAESEQAQVRTKCAIAPP